MKLLNLIFLSALLCFSSAIQAKQCNQGKVTSVAEVPPLSAMGKSFRLK